MGIINTMIDPIALSVCLIVASIMMLAMLLTIIKNGYSIRERFRDRYYDKNYYHLVISKVSSLPLFIAVCKMITNNRNKINCKQWQIMNITDSNGKPTIFLIPSANRYFVLSLADDEHRFTLYTAGNYNGSLPDISAFKIFFHNQDDMKNFIDLVFKDCTMPMDSNFLIKQD